jgi:hypothetical protein
VLKHLPEMPVDEILAVMASVLRRLMLDGKAVGSVRSWDYFAPAILDELHKQRIAELGVRPGDVLGLHRQLRETADV